MSSFQEVASLLIKTSMNTRQTPFVMKMRREAFELIRKINNEILCDVMIIKQNGIEIGYKMCFSTSFDTINAGYMFQHLLNKQDDNNEVQFIGSIVPKLQYIKLIGTEVPIGDGRNNTPRFERRSVYVPSDTVEAFKEILESGKNIDEENMENDA